MTGMTHFAGDCLCLVVVRRVVVDVVGATVVALKSSSVISVKFSGDRIFFYTKNTNQNTLTVNSQ